MTILHMETNLVRDNGFQLQQTAQTIADNNLHLHSSVQNLLSNWQGAAAGIFAAEFQQIWQQLQHLAASAAQLQDRLQREVDEWERVGGTFGAGSGVYSKNQPIEGGLTADDYPLTKTQRNASLSITSQADIYNLINENKKTEPIKIIQIGENDYLVTIAGTDPKEFGPANNWTHAILSGMGLPGDYEIEVRKFIMSEIPPGASIHLTGHSQGGIVANNLADNADFAAGYEIKSVTTYGAPISARPLEGVLYKRFAAEGDPVPYLRTYYALDLVGNESMQQVNVDTAVDGFFNFSEAHGSYSYLSNDNLTDKSLYSIDYLDIDTAYLDSNYIIPATPPQDTTTVMGQINQVGAAIYGKGNQIIGDAIAGQIEMTGDRYFLELNVRSDIDNLVDRLNRGYLNNAGQIGDVLQTNIIAGSQAVIDVSQTVGQTAIDVVEKSANSAENLLKVIF